MASKKQQLELTGKLCDLADSLNSEIHLPVRYNLLIADLRSMRKYHEETKDSNLNVFLTKANTLCNYLEVLARTRGLPEEIISLMSDVRSLPVKEVKVDDDVEPTTRTIPEPSA